MHRTMSLSRTITRHSGQSTREAGQAAGSVVHFRLRHVAAIVGPLLQRHCTDRKRAAACTPVLGFSPRLKAVTLAVGTACSSGSRSGVQSTGDAGAGSGVGAGGPTSGSGSGDASSSGASSGGSSGSGSLDGGGSACDGGPCNAVPAGLLNPD